MTAAAVHPLQTVKTLLAQAARHGDAELLAECLAGEHLPALGGHQNPAELLYQALALPPVEPDVIGDASRLLATLAKRRAAAPAALGPVALFNLLLLASDLPAEAELFAALKELRAAGLGDQVALRQLRRALVVQQVDASLEDSWLGLLSAYPGQSQLTDDRKDEILDAWSGLLWIPPTEAEQAAGDSPERGRIDRGLRALHDAVEWTPEALSVLRYAVQQLDESFPRSPEFWAEIHAACSANWPQLLRDVVAERWQIVDPEEATAAESRISFADEDAKAVWTQLAGDQRDRVAETATAGDPRGWNSLWGDLIFHPPPAGWAVQKWRIGLQAVRAAFEALNPRLHLARAVPGVAEAVEEYRVETTKGRRPLSFDRLKEFDRVNRSVAAIQDRLRAGDLDRARSFLAELVQSQESMGTAANLIAKTLSKVAASAMSVGQYQWGEELYHRAAVAAVDDPVPSTGLAEVWKAQGRYEEAERQYQTTVERFPQDVVARNGLAEVWKAQGRYEEAERQYQTTVERFPDNVVARNGLAEVWKAQGRYEEAERQYQTTVERFPDDVFARTGLAEVWKAQGRYEEAERQYQTTVERFPDNVVARTGLAEVWKAQGRYEEAERQYQTTVERFPQDVVARNGLAEVWKAQGRYEEAERQYQTTVERFPDNVVARNGLAEVWKAQGRYEEAERKYRATRERFPGDLAARNGLANVLRAGRRFEEALVVLPEPDILRTLQDHFDLHLRGMILLAMGDTSSAIRAFERGLGASPPREWRPSYLNALALARLRERRYVEARRDLAALAEPTPETETIALHIAAELKELEAARTQCGQLTARILTFPRPTATALETISSAWGLGADQRFRQPTPAERDEVFAAEIEMLAA